MTAVLQSIHKFEFRFHHILQWFGDHHPYISFAAAFIILPVAMVGMVFLGTTAIVLPIAWFFGYM